MKAALQYKYHPDYIVCPLIEKSFSCLLSFPLLSISNEAAICHAIDPFSEQSR